MSIKHSADGNGCCADARPRCYLENQYGINTKIDDNPATPLKYPIFSVLNSQYQTIPVINGVLQQSDYPPIGRYAPCSLQLDITGINNAVDYDQNCGDCTDLNTTVYAYPEYEGSNRYVALFDRSPGYCENICVAFESAHAGVSGVYCNMLLNDGIASFCDSVDLGTQSIGTLTDYGTYGDSDLNGYNLDFTFTPTVACSGVSADFSTASIRVRRFSDNYNKYLIAPSVPNVSPLIYERSPVTDAISISLVFTGVQNITALPDNELKVTDCKTCTDINNKVIYLYRRYYPFQHSSSENIWRGIIRKYSNDIAAATPLCDNFGKVNGSDTCIDAGMNLVIIDLYYELTPSTISGLVSTHDINLHIKMYQNGNATPLVHLKSPTYSSIEYTYTDINCPCYTGGTYILTAYLNGDFTAFNGVWTVVSTSATNQCDWSNATVTLQSLGNISINPTPVCYTNTNIDFHQLILKPYSTIFPTNVNSCTNKFRARHCSSTYYFNGIETGYVTVSLNFPDYIYGSNCINVGVSDELFYTHVSGNTYRFTVKRQGMVDTECYGEITIVNVDYITFLADIDSCGNVSNISVETVSNPTRFWV